MSRGRKKLIVKKDELQSVVDKLESETAFKNMSQLYKAVADTEWAKNIKDEDGNVKSLKSQVVGLRIKEHDIDCKTTKGKAGRGGSGSDSKEKKGDLGAIEDDPSIARNHVLAETLGINKVTRIPAGSCPVRLRGVDSDSVYGWCNDLQTHFNSKGQCLAPEGMMYYVASNYYTTTSPEYRKVSEHVYEWVESMLGVA